MKTYEFQCGGDHGSWDCIVDVELNEEEENLLVSYVNKTGERRLSSYPPYTDLFFKVLDALEEQGVDGEDMSLVVVYVPDVFYQ